MGGWSIKKPFLKALLNEGMEGFKKMALNTNYFTKLKLKNVSKNGRKSLTSKETEGLRAILGVVTPNNSVVHVSEKS